MYYSIYRNNISIIQVKPLDSSELSQQKQVEDIVRLDFVLNSYIALEIGDYIILDKTEQKYFLNKLPNINESSVFEYECVFEGSLHNLKNTKILLDKDFNFPLTGNAHTFLQFIVENLNINGSYAVGNYAETETLTVEFANWNAFEAITELSKLLSFDWYLEGTTLNFDAKNYETPYVFNPGMKKGFTKLTRTTVESSPIKTVVYGYGSTLNLPPRTGDEPTYNSPLLTENRLYFDGVGGDSKLEKNTDLYGIREHIEVFDNIQPERTGIITDTDSEDFQVFFDTDLDFDINDQLMEGIKPKIKFISGALLGLEFNISYDNSSKKITMDLFTDESGVYPNETIKPSVGNQYKMFDIIMPQVDRDNATGRLKAATQEYLDNNSKGMVIYEGEVDNEFIEANEISLDIGDTVRVVSGAFAIDAYYEIKALTQSITKPTEYSIQFGDILPKSLILLLQQANFDTQQSIYNVSSTQVTNNDIVNNIGQDLSWLNL